MDVRVYLILCVHGVTRVHSDDDPSKIDTGLDQTDVLPPTPMVGGKYRLGRLLGEGGMGAVYEAEHTGLEVRVAVKLLNEVFVTDPSAMSRFQREAKAAAAIRHPNIVEVTDTGTDEDGVPFIVMELLEGESLSSLLRREKILSDAVAGTVTCQILSGLAAAHSKGVIHRDLKPGNIILANLEDGTCQVKILDFGISKFFAGTAVLDVTATGAVIGTPRFMAPEQARGQSDLDGRVDIYAVGVLLYRMLTGKLPFAAKGHEEIIRSILDGNVRAPHEIRKVIDPDLERIILKAMATEREDRYLDAQSFLEELNAAIPEVAGGTVQIASHTGITHTGSTGPRTPATLTRPSSVMHPGTIRTAQETRPASPRALRQDGQRSPLRWIAPLIILTGIIVAGGWYFFMRGPVASGVHGHTADPDVGVPLKGKPIRFGITRFLPERQLKEEHENLVDYLQKRLMRPVLLEVHEDYIDLSLKLSQGKLELAGLSSYHYVQARRRVPGLKLLGTHVTSSGTSYEGVILARAEANIRSLEDLKGKVFCYVGPNSTSGYLYPRAVFRQKGMDPDKSFKVTRFAGDHIKALKALLIGACDGAAVFAGIFFEAKKHGMPPQKFTILGTTARIPYDAYCASPGMDKSLVHSLREALLALKPGTDAATSVLGQNSRIIGFATAKDSDWNPVRRIEKFLDAPPTDVKKD